MPRPLPSCPAPRCTKALQNHGAESHGDGDIFDLLWCPDHGPVYHFHADYCRCRDCRYGENKLHDVWDPEYVPDFVPGPPF